MATPELEEPPVPVVRGRVELLLIGPTELALDGELLWLMTEETVAAEVEW